MGNLEPESKLPIARLIVPRKENKENDAPDASVLMRPITFILLFVGYVAFFLSGFGTFLEHIGPSSFRAFPLYLYCILLLLILQRQIIERANNARIKSGMEPIAGLRRVYIGLASLVALLYAAWAGFFGGPANPLVFPLTYVIVDLIALIGFAYEILEPKKPSGRLFGDIGRARSTSRWSTSSPEIIALENRVHVVMEWASEAASLAVFCILAGVILQLIAGYVVVSLPFGAHFFSLAYLWQFNIALGFLAGFIALFLFVFIAVQIASATETARFYELLLIVVRYSFEHALASFRVAVSPLIWLFPAFAIAAFAQQVTTFFATAASAVLPHGVVDLFNPFSATNYSYLSDGAIDIGLTIASVLAVLFASVLSEADTHYGAQAARRVAALGRMLVALVPLFLLSLVVFNAFLYITFESPLPFQLLAATLTTAVIAAVYAFVFWLGSRKRAAGKSEASS